MGFGQGEGPSQYSKVTKIPGCPSWWSYFSDSRVLPEEAPSQTTQAASCYHVDIDRSGQGPSHRGVRIHPDLWHGQICGP